MSIIQTRQFRRGRQNQCGNEVGSLREDMKYGYKPTQEHSHTAGSGIALVGRASCRLITYACITGDCLSVASKRDYHSENKQNRWTEFGRRGTFHLQSFPTQLTCPQSLVWLSSSMHSSVQFSSIYFHIIKLFTNTTIQLTETKYNMQWFIWKHSSVYYNHEY